MQNIVTPYIRTGAWYSHSESILLSLLGIADGDGGKLAVDMIETIRGQYDLGDTSVSPRLMPKLTFEGHHSSLAIAGRKKRTPLM